MSTSDTAQDDAVFWDRLAGMPHWEAEQECVMRRESLVLENAMLNTERSKLMPPIGEKQRREVKDIGAAMADNNARICKLVEQIKYLRKLADKIHWRETVRDLFGDDAVEQCIVHMEARWQDIYGQRRQWAADAKGAKW